jgi:hypothetical protein
MDKVQKYNSFSTLLSTLEPATGPYSEPDKSSLHPPTLFPYLLIYA